MYQIELDFKKATVFIPKETAEIIEFPTEVTFLLSNVDASLLLMTGDLTRNKNAVRRGRPANSQNRSFQRSWDDKANGYRIKSTLPTRSEITKWFPGSEEGIARGVYILNGDLIDNNRILFDFSTAQMLTTNDENALPIDLSNYLVVNRSFFRQAN